LKLETGIISPELQINSWDDLAPYFERLQQSEPASVAEMELLLRQYSEVLSVFAEQNAWAYINMTRHTDDKAALERHELFSTKIMPEVERATHAFEEKITNHPLFDELPEPRYTVLKRELRRNLEMFREENIPLMTELSQLSTEYNKIIGALSVTLDGEELPLPRARVRLQWPQRAKRQEAWLAIKEVMLSKAEELDRLFDEMLRKRQQIARNAGYDNFRDYQHDNLHRFDYTPEDALAFDEAVAEVVVPLAREIQEAHRKRLGLDPDDYRPWDTAAVPPDEQPLRPFRTGQELLDKTKAVFRELHPLFGENLEKMEAAGLFDLESRKGKAPGGYNYPLEVTGMPFIFMNAAGIHRDVVTLMHEGGHAMHTFLVSGEPLIQYRDTPAEMAETASMSMELLTASGWRKFYDEADYRRARREHLEDIIELLPWIATVDSFQHWIYLNPGHTVAERDAAFEGLMDKYTSGLVNWDGYEDYRRKLWHRQLHIFEVPFYYVEYGIAQLGALQVYRNYRQDPQRALQSYIAGLKLGSSRPLPEVWGSMDLKFDFSAGMMKSLVDFVADELHRLQE